MAHAFTIAFVVLLGVVLPFLAVLNGRALERAETPPRWEQFFLSTVITQGVLLAMALGVAWANSYRLFTPPSVGRDDVLWGAAFLALAALAAAISWRLTSPAKRQRLLTMLPHTRREHTLNLVLLVLVAITEETVYRGVLFRILEGYTGHWWPAALLTALAFAGGHAIQGLRSAAIVLVFALGFQALVRVTGDLYTAMAVHLVFDAVAITAYTRLGRREERAQAPDVR